MATAFIGYVLWRNEFLGSYSKYKVIISFSIFNRMGFWRTLGLQRERERRRGREIERAGARERER